MKRAFPLTAAAVFVSTAASALGAQTASTASRLYPETHAHEIAYQTGLHLNQYVLALSYRTSLGLPATDFGLYFAFLDREATGSLTDVGIDVRHLLARASSPTAPLGLDVAAVAGVHIAGKDVFSGETDRAAVTIPLGITVGRPVTERGRIYAHPRVEYSSQRNICDDLRPERCATRWIPKLEVGGQIRLTPGLFFGVAILTGDSRFSGPGLAMGGTWVWH